MGREWNWGGLRWKGKVAGTRANNKFCPHHTSTERAQPLRWRRHMFLISRMHSKGVFSELLSIEEKDHALDDCSKWQNSYLMDSYSNDVPLHRKILFYMNSGLVQGMDARSTRQIDTMTIRQNIRCRGSQASVLRGTFGTPHFQCRSKYPGKKKALQAWTGGFSSA